MQIDNTLRNAVDIEKIVAKDKNSCQLSQKY